MTGATLLEVHSTDAAGKAAALGGALVVNGSEHAQVAQRRRCDGDNANALAIICHSRFVSRRETTTRRTGLQIAASLPCGNRAS
jgi:hypothetical protein